MAMTVLGFAALFVIGIPIILFLFFKVHQTLDRVCVKHAQAYCEKNKLKINRFRWQPAFDQRGIKTEYTKVQLDCLDAQMQRKLVLILVWPFGVRRLLSNEAYPETYEQQWPTIAGNR